MKVKPSIELPFPVLTSSIRLSNRLLGASDVRHRAPWPCQVNRVSSGDGAHAS